MDDPNALATAATQLRNVANMFQKTVDVLQNNNLKLGQSSFQLVGSWSGQGATAFLDASSHIQQTSSNCMTGLDQAVSSCQSAAGRIESALPTLFRAKSASQQVENGGINEVILKAIEDGNKAQSDLTSSIGALSQAIDLATASLGKCEEQQQGGESAGGEEGNPFLEKLGDIMKDDFKDALKESLVEHLKEWIKEWQKEHSQSGSPAS